MGTSYVQYHWCPITLTVNAGSFCSSIAYKRANDGYKIKSTINIGNNVHDISNVVCAVKKKFLGVNKFVALNL
jgi:hypothetical protein